MEGLPGVTTGPGGSGSSRSSDTATTTTTTKTSTIHEPVRQADIRMDMLMQAVVQGSASPRTAGTILLVWISSAVAMIWMTSEKGDLIRVLFGCIAGLGLLMAYSWIFSTMAARLPRQMLIGRCPSGVLGYVFLYGSGPLCCVLISAGLAYCGSRPYLDHEFHQVTLLVCLVSFAIGFAHGISTAFRYMGRWMRKLKGDISETRLGEHDDSETELSPHQIAMLKRLDCCFIHLFQCVCALITLAYIAELSFLFSWELDSELLFSVFFVTCMYGSFLYFVVMILRVLRKTKATTNLIGSRTEMQESSLRLEVLSNGVTADRCDSATDDPLSQPLLIV